MTLFMLLLLLSHVSRVGAAKLAIDQVNFET